MGMSQYFDNDKNIKSERKLINFSFNDKNFSLYTDNGVFSKDKLDYGTRILLENIDINNLKGRVLDLGCGIGVVGIILGTLNKNISIDMVDINERAIILTKDNVKFNNINNNVFVSNVYSNINGKYNYIITNPPIRAGKEVVRKFLLGGYDYLTDDGILYFVIRKDQGALSIKKILEETKKVEIINRDKGYFIIKAKNQ